MGRQTMEGDVSGGVAPFEVRCPRCHVTFPVETRRCIHCGGATAAAKTRVAAGVVAGPIEPTTGGRVATGAAGTSSHAPIGPGPISANPTMPAPNASRPVPIDLEEDGELAGEAGAPPSVGAALLRSFGSLFWIIALIGFSFLRNCSEG